MKHIENLTKILVKQVIKQVVKTSYLNNKLVKKVDETIDQTCWWDKLAKTQVDQTKCWCGEY